MLPGPLELLVLQPTPFCNINCSYCYLPDRASTRRMTSDTLEQAFRWVFASGLAREPFNLLWHAGEPMVAGVPFYEEAARLLERHNTARVPVIQSIQTNATLIDDAWCAFLRQHEMDVGVSVDGPAFLHDRHRRTRQGEGTLERVLHGIHLLHQHDIPFQALTVLTADALDYPDELFDFYRENGISSVAFNVEEVEGPHTVSSMEGPGIPRRFRRFLTRFLRLALCADPPLAVREFDSATGAMAKAHRFAPGSRTQENKPWAIVNIDWAGNFSTFSPELLGLSDLRLGEFAVGNVYRNSLAEVIASPRFQRMALEVERGVQMCEQQCAYFPFCGGGPPANKYFENKTFASTETTFCRLHKQACVDVALSLLEEQAAHTGPAN